VTALIRADPEIVTSKEKESLKSILKTLIKIDEMDNEYYSTSGNGALQAEASKIRNPVQQNAG